MTADVNDTRAIIAIEIEPKKIVVHIHDVHSSKIKLAEKISFFSVECFVLMERSKPNCFA